MLETENKDNSMEFKKLTIAYIQNRYLEATSEDAIIIDLMAYFQIENPELLEGDTTKQAAAFKKVIGELETEGLITRTKKGKIASSEVFGIYAGKLSINAKGFGFLMRDNRELSDIFIPTKHLNEAMNNDRVLVKVRDTDSFGREGRFTKTKAGERQEGEVIRIITRANTFVTGTFNRNKDFGFVVPDDQKIIHDIYISKFNAKDLKDGFKVVVEIIKWPSEGNNPEGKIAEVLGHKGDKGIDILSIAKSRGLPMEFPEEVLAQAEKVPSEIKESDIVGRRDLRNELIITIDGDDAKDLDDAVSLSKKENGHYLLGVHIADVSQYVFENSPLDKEALDRGTSIYMVDRVLPMLPPRLSNGICSLNPKVDRLTLSCAMELDGSGNVVSYEIFESVIRTTERMTYKNVNKIFDEDPETLERYDHIKGMLMEMKGLQEILFNRRNARGSIDFEFPETKITLDENGFPEDIRPYDRGISERVIEEFMLICNETVAEDMFWKELPFVYRVHETPDPERIKAFSDFAHNFNLKLAGSVEDLKPMAFQQMMELIKGKREERLISTMMLRSLKKARYTAECLGHFGLAAKYYCHFTSPIRRYPDLQIHRIIKENIHGKLNEKRIKHYDSILGEVAFHSSERERVADEAEREVDDMKKAEYMSRHVGEEFDGIITSVAGFGFYVELPSTIEGLVHVNSLVDDYYEYDDTNHLLRGERRNLVFRIGDEVKIRVDKADVGARKIDFSVVEKLSSSVGNMEMSAGEATNISDYRIKPRRTAVSGKEALRNVREQVRHEVAGNRGKVNRNDAVDRPFSGKRRAGSGVDALEFSKDRPVENKPTPASGYDSRSRSKKAQDKIDGTSFNAGAGVERGAGAGTGRPYTKQSGSINANEGTGARPYYDKKDKKKKMGFSEYIQTEKPTFKKSNAKRDPDEPYAGYKAETGRDTGAYEERVTGVDYKQKRKQESIARSIAEKKYTEKGTTHRKGQGGFKGESNRDFSEQEYQGENALGNEKPKPQTEAGAKSTNYYIEKYGHLKPSKPSGGNKKGGAGKAGGRTGGSGSGGSSASRSTTGGSGSKAASDKNKEGYKKRKGK